MSRINPDARVIAEAEARVYISGQGTGGNPSSSPEKSAVVGSVDTDGTLKMAGRLGLTPFNGPFYLGGNY